MIDKYSDEIEAIYEAVEATTQTSVPLPREWDIVSATDFVGAVVSSVLVHEVKDDDDIFQHGCDSLQATWIRNTLTRALRDSIEFDTRTSADNFVYDHPTISSLATFLFAHISGDRMDKAKGEIRKKDMEEMASRYSTSFPIHIPGTKPLPDFKTVLLTGSTGGLGAYTLSALVANQAVERVYCLNRPSKPGFGTLLDRQQASLLDKGLPLSILESEKVTLLEGILDEPQWGLGKPIYDMMQESVTHIIHNAWPVNFNLSLASFEANVKGLRGLIDFALSSPFHYPPTLIYTSSIGVFRHPTAGQGVDILPELPIEAQVAVGTGYTESKWVSEQVLGAASTSSPLKAIIVRVGQISGGPNGFWSTKEWFPAIIQSTQFVSCLPMVDKEVSWIPVHVAGESLVDYMDTSEPGIVHLVHPNPTPWLMLAKVLSSELGVPLVPYHEWLSKLEHLAVSQQGGANVVPNSVAALRLLNFYRSTELALRMDAEEEKIFEAFGVPRLSVQRSLNASLTLAKVEQLSGADTKLWLAYWYSVGFM